jgi:PPOX class probable F420-dependent enzyme
MKGAYLNLATFKRNGDAVETAMWFVTLGDVIYLFTDGTSYKVKRLRRDKRIRIAPCNVSGKVSGDWIDGTGEIIDDPSVAEQVYTALKQKYGWQMRLLDLVSTLGRRIGGRAIIALQV